MQPPALRTLKRHSGGVADPRRAPSRIVIAAMGIVPAVMWALSSAPRRADRNDVKYRGGKKAGAVVFAG